MVHPKAQTNILLCKEGAGSPKLATGPLGCTMNLPCEASQDDCQDVQMYGVHPSTSWQEILSY